MRHNNKCVLLFQLFVSQYRIDNITKKYIVDRYLHYKERDNFVILYCFDWH